MKYLLSIFIILFYGTFCSAQHSLTGKVLDNSNVALTGATVVLLDQDSTMIAFGITNEKGDFLLTDIDSSDYILQLSYVSYANYSKVIDITWKHKKIDLGTFVMNESSEVLQEVTIKAEHIPMGLNGDTISYNTAAFKTKPGASVEDLLKKLPGIEVQRDGSIKAQGEDVEKVLVEGKEFFGNDPKIATQNLEAEAVDKVQVFDKQSEIAEFTGIADGQDEKTINLKLKEGYKSGGFGNVDLAGGSDDRYEGKINYNRFNTKLQASTILSANNINKQPFSFNDYISMMGGLSAAMSGNIRDFNFEEFGQNRSPEGIIDNYTGGLNFNYDFSDKLKWTSNYFYLQRDKYLDRQSSSIEFLDNQTYATIDTSKSNTQNQNHSINTKLVYKQSPFTELVLKNSFQGADAYFDEVSNTLFNSAIGQNMTGAVNLGNENRFGYDGQLQARKKFGKKGRNWISTIDYSTKKIDSENTVMNEFLLRKNSYTLNQEQLYSSRESQFILNTNYTEPIAKGKYIGINYSFTENKETPFKDFFDFSDGDKILNNELSDAFIKNLSYHLSGISFRINKKKSKFNLRINHQSTKLSGSISKGDQIVKDNYNHVLPMISYDLDLSRSKSIKLAYETSLGIPTLQQLMPLLDNSNPNLLILGNPALVPAYTHSFNFSFNYFDNFNFRNLFANVNLSVINDHVVNQVDIDDSLLRTIQPINTDRFINGNAYLSYAQPIKALKLKYRISMQAYVVDYITFLNGKQSDVTESNTNLNLTLENRNKDLIDFAGGIKLDYNTRAYSLQSDFNQKFFNQSLFFDSNLFITESLTLSSSFDFRSFSGETFSAAQNFKLWNASIEKTFNNSKVAVKLSVFDILGENQGISRSGGLNSLIESRYNTLESYFLLGIRYRIGKVQKKGISFG